MPLKPPKFLARHQARADAVAASRKLQLERWLAYRPHAPPPSEAEPGALSMDTLRAAARQLADGGVPPGDAGEFGRCYQAEVPEPEWLAFEETAECLGALFSGEIAVSIEPWFRMPTQSRRGASRFVLLRVPAGRE